MRRAARKDGNHNDVAKWLREMGAYVDEMHQVGKGFPDLLVQRRRGEMLLPAEVKRKGGKMNAMQVAWWAAHGLKPVILETMQDCARFMGARQAAQPVRNS